MRAIVEKVVTRERLVLKKQERKKVFVNMPRAPEAADCDSPCLGTYVRTPLQLFARSSMKKGVLRFGTVNCS